MAREPRCQLGERGLSYLVSWVALGIDLAVRSNQARIGYGIVTGITRTANGRNSPDIRQMMHDADSPRTWKRETPNWSGTDSDDSSVVLSGVIGIMRLDPANYPQVVFELHTTVEAGEFFLDETLSIDELFWLSVGCIPTSGESVFSLEDVVQVPEAQSPTAPRETPAFSPFLLAPWDLALHHPAAYVPQPLPLNQHAVPEVEIVPMLFRFTAVQDRDESLSSVAATFGAEDNNTKALSLQEVEIVPEDLDEIKVDAGRTYVRSERAWIRLRHNLESSLCDRWFLDRESAEQLARALDDLPLCAMGYLVHRPRHPACRQLLVEGTVYMPLLLIRISREVEALDLDVDRRTLLTESMFLMWKGTKDFEYTREFSAEINLPDKCLAGCITASIQVQRAIQILAIINPEFRDIICSSAQRIADCIHSNTLIDYVAGTVNVRTFMGIMQKFPMHLVQLADEPPRAGLPSNVTVTYPDTLLLVLKASVRGTSSTPRSSPCPCMRRSRV
ncbi:hypothetical protein LTR17_005129 [Elasticomyces elasticus]|nr:hypothetical protein LTR17_005129 [Elasticomyces elasticus]